MSTSRIADEIRASVDRRDRHIRAHLDTLDACSPVVVDEMWQHHQTRHRLEGLEMGLEALTAYHGEDGQIPVAEVRALIDAVQS